MKDEERIWKDRKEFLLKEHDALVGEINNVRQERDRWYRFYLIIVTAVGSVILYLSRPPSGNNPGMTENSVFNYMAAILLLALFLVGFLTLWMELRQRELLVEYHNAINRIRRYFIDRLTNEHFRYDRYFAIRHTDDLKTFKFFGYASLRAYVILIVNTVVCAGFLYFLAPNKIKLLSLFLILICADIFVIQIYLICKFLTDKDKTYKSEFPLPWGKDRSHVKISEKDKYLLGV